jgi:hypothetical protein
MKQKKPITYDWQTAMSVGVRLFGWGWEGPEHKWGENDTGWFIALALTYRKKWKG